MTRLPLLLTAAVVSAAVWVSAAPGLPHDALDLYTMPQSQDQAIAVTMIGKATTPPHIAVPPFVVLTADQTTQDASKTLTTVLSYDLKFEREFDVMPATAYTGVPSSQSVDDVPYERWAQLGADFVALGQVKVAAGGKFDVEVNVVSIREKRVSYRAGFQSDARGLRRVAHTFSDEMHEKMRGVAGVARTRIAFSSTRDGERIGKTVEERSAKEIYIMDYDGANQMKVTPHKSLDISPSWCPDGQCLAYMSYLSGFPDIIVQNIYGQIGNSKPAHGTDAVHNYLPRFSPDGRQLAYGSSRNGQAMDVYVVNRDGTGERRLTNHPKSDNAPTWSPSGNMIAFTSDRSGSNLLYTMNTDGGELQQVPVGCGGHCDRPTFAPGMNGLLLAYSTQTGVGHDIEFYDFSSRATRRLTNGEGTNESPSFSPNGRHVMFFTSRGSGKNQIAVVDIDGKNVRILTKDGENTFPSWSGFLK